MTTVATATQTTTTSSLGLTGKSPISSDFTTFLKMLTTQMQNQDPLDPINSADYAQQLATFSGVEQQVKTNDLLGSLAAQFGVLGMSQLAGWVGQQARSAAPVHFDGTPVTLSAAPAAGADRAVLVVRDANGTVVSQEEMPLSSDPYQWLGGDDEGNILPGGNYSLSLESYAGDALMQRSAVESYGEIIEARSTPGGTILVLKGGIEVDATEVTALRKT